MPADARLLQLSVYEKILGWIVFLVVMAISWAVAVPKAKQRCDDDVFPRGHLIPSAGILVRRPYLIALCAYAVIVSWFYVAFLSLALLVWCTVLTMTKGKIKDHEAWEKLVDWFAKPTAVLHALHESHAAAHAIFAIGSLVGMALVVAFYVTDEDLVAGQTAQTPTSPTVAAVAPAYYVKTMRGLVLVPAVMGIAYVLYAVVHIATG